MCMVLHQHDHSHGHGHGHKHGSNKENDSNAIPVDDDAPETSHQRHWWQKLKRKQANNEQVAQGKTQNRQRKKDGHKNINVRAAFIHVIGDLIQSIGVVIAGYIIKFFVSKYSVYCHHTKYFIATVAYC